MKYIKTTIALASVLVFAQGCFKTKSTCEELGNCEDSSAGSSAGGSSSNGGSSGGGASATDACGNACKGATPVCNETSGKCVGCLETNDCSASAPVCDTSTNVCVQCLKNANCSSAAKPVCDTSDKVCVGCLAKTDCTKATASVCDTATNTCSSCSVDVDCAHISGKTACSAGTCVACTGTNYTGCGVLEGKALVCESLTNTCSTDKTVQSTGLCQPCVSDAQCNPGQLCYQETFGGTAVGYFCFWKQGDTVNGAPADCKADTNRLYVKVDADVASVDGTTATLCTLRASTCKAINQFSDTNCAPGGVADDKLCGFAPGVDSKCALYSSVSGTYRCTTACLSDSDCDLTCDTGASPKVCRFQ